MTASATENVCRCLQYHDFPMEGLKNRPGPVAVLILAKRAIIACLNPTCLARLGSPTHARLTPHNLRRNTFLQCCPIKRRQSLCHSGGILTSTVAGQKKENRIERLRLIDHPLETGMNRHEFSWQTPWLPSK